jgi:hypothetical protein
MKTLGSLILLVVGLFLCTYGAVGLIGTTDGKFLSPLSLAEGFGSLVFSFLLLLASNKLVRVGRYLYFPLAVPVLDTYSRSLLLDLLDSIGCPFIKKSIT